MEEQHLLHEVDGNVAIIRINRPKVLNALSLPLMEDLANLLEPRHSAFRKRESMGCWC